MFRVGIANIGGLRRRMRRYLKAWTIEYERELEKALRMIHQGVTSRTPVNTGQTLANYQWSVGTPAGGIVAHDETGETGRTNEMVIGEEPRRPANQAITDRSLESLPFGKLSGKKIYLTNNAPQWRGLENGMLPESPFVQRSPNGMVSLTMAMVTAQTRLVRVG